MNANNASINLNYNFSDGWSWLSWYIIRINWEIYREWTSGFVWIEAIWAEEFEEWENIISVVLYDNVWNVSEAEDKLYKSSYEPELSFEVIKDNLIEYDWRDWINVATTWWVNVEYVVVYTWQFEEIKLEYFVWWVSRWEIILEWDAKEWREWTWSINIDLWYFSEWNNELRIEVRDEIWNEDLETANVSKDTIEPSINDFSISWYIDYEWEKWINAAIPSINLNYNFSDGWSWLSWYIIRINWELYLTWDYNLPNSNIVLNSWLFEEWENIIEVYLYDNVLNLNTEIEKNTITLWKAWVIPWLVIYNQERFVDSWTWFLEYDWRDWINEDTLKIWFNYEATYTWTLDALDFNVNIYNDLHPLGLNFTWFELSRDWDDDIVVWNWYIEIDYSSLYKWENRIEVVFWNWSLNSFFQDFIIWKWINPEIEIDIKRIEDYSVLDLIEYSWFNWINKATTWVVFNYNFDNEIVQWEYELLLNGSWFLYTWTYIVWDSSRFVNINSDYLIEWLNILEYRVYDYLWNYSEYTFDIWKDSIDPEIDSFELFVNFKNNESYLTWLYNNLYFNSNHSDLFVKLILTDTWSWLFEINNNIDWQNLSNNNISHTEKHVINTFLTWYNITWYDFDIKISNTSYIEWKYLVKVDVYDNVWNHSYITWVFIKDTISPEITNIALKVNPDNVASWLIWWELWFVKFHDIDIIFQNYHQYTWWILPFDWSINNRSVNLDWIWDKSDIELLSIDVLHYKNWVNNSVWWIYHYNFDYFDNNFFSWFLENMSWSIEWYYVFNYNIKDRAWNYNNKYANPLILDYTSPNFDITIDWINWLTPVVDLYWWEWWDWYYYVDNQTYKIWYDLSIHDKSLYSWDYVTNVSWIRSVHFEFYRNLEWGTWDFVWHKTEVFNTNDFDQVLFTETPFWHRLDLSWVLEIWFTNWEHVEEWIYEIDVYAVDRLWNRFKQPTWIRLVVKRDVPIISDLKKRYNWSWVVLDFWSIVWTWITWTWDRADWWNIDLYWLNNQSPTDEFFNIQPVIYFDDKYWELRQRFQLYFKCINSFPYENKIFAERPWSLIWYKVTDNITAGIFSGTFDLDLCAYDNLTWSNWIETSIIDWYPLNKRITFTLSLSDEIWNSWEWGTIVWNMRKVSFNLFTLPDAPRFSLIDTNWLLDQTQWMDFTYNNEPDWYTFTTKENTFQVCLNWIWDNTIWLWVWVRNPSTESWDEAWTSFGGTSLSDGCISNDLFQFDANSRFQRKDYYLFYYSSNALDWPLDRDQYADAEENDLLRSRRTYFTIVKNESQAIAASLRTHTVWAKWYRYYTPAFGWPITFPTTLWEFSTNQDITSIQNIKHNRPDEVWEAFVEFMQNKWLADDDWFFMKSELEGTYNYSWTITKWYMDWWITMAGSIKAPIRLEWSWPTILPNNYVYLTEINPIWVFDSAFQEYYSKDFSYVYILNNLNDFWDWILIFSWSYPDWTLVQSVFLRPYFSVAPKEFTIPNKNTMPIIKLQDSDFISCNEELDGYCFWYINFNYKFPENYPEYYVPNPEFDEEQPEWPQNRAQIKMSSSTSYKVSWEYAALYDLTEFKSIPSFWCGSSYYCSEYSAFSEWMFRIDMHSPKIINISSSDDYDTSSYFSRSLYNSKYPEWHRRNHWYVWTKTTFNFWYQSWTWASLWRIKWYEYYLYDSLWNVVCDHTSPNCTWSKTSAYYVPNDLSFTISLNLNFVKNVLSDWELYNLVIYIKDDSWNWSNYSTTYDVSNNFLNTSNNMSLSHKDYNQKPLNHYFTWVVWDDFELTDFNYNWWFNLLHRRIINYPLSNTVFTWTTSTSQSVFLSWTHVNVESLDYGKSTDWIYVIDQKNDLINDSFQILWFYDGLFGWLEYYYHWNYWTSDVNDNLMKLNNVDIITWEWVVPIALKINKEIFSERQSYNDIYDNTWIYDIYIWVNNYEKNSLRRNPAYDLTHNNVVHITDIETRIKNNQDTYFPWPTCRTYPDANQVRTSIRNAVNSVRVWDPDNASSIQQAQDNKMLCIPDLYMFEEWWYYYIITNTIHYQTYDPDFHDWDDVSTPRTQYFKNNNNPNDNQLVSKHIEIRKHAWSDNAGYLDNALSSRVNVRYHTTRWPPTPPEFLATSWFIYKDIVWCSTSECMNDPIDENRVYSSNSIWRYDYDFNFLSVDNWWHYVSWNNINFMTFNSQLVSEGSKFVKVDADINVWPARLELFNLFWVNRLPQIVCVRWYAKTTCPAGVNNCPYYIYSDKICFDVPWEKLNWDQFWVYDKVWHDTNLNRVIDWWDNILVNNASSNSCRFTDKNWFDFYECDIDITWLIDTFTPPASHWVENTLINMRSTSSWSLWFQNEISEISAASPSDPFMFIWWIFSKFSTPSTFWNNNNLSNLSSSFPNISIAFWDFPNASKPRHLWPPNWPLFGMRYNLNASWRTHTLPSYINPFSLSWTLSKLQNGSYVLLNDSIWKDDFVIRTKWDTWWINRSLNSPMQTALSDLSIQHNWLWTLNTDLDYGTGKFRLSLNYQDAPMFAQDFSSNICVFVDWDAPIVVDFIPWDSRHKLSWWTGHWRLPYGNNNWINMFTCDSYRPCPFVVRQNELQNTLFANQSHPWNIIYATDDIFVNKQWLLVKDIWAISYSNSTFTVRYSWWTRSEIQDLEFDDLSIRYSWTFQSPNWPSKNYLSWNNQNSDPYSCSSPEFRHYILEANAPNSTYNNNSPGKYQMSYRVCDVYWRCVEWITDPWYYDPIRDRVNLSNFEISYWDWWQYIWAKSMTWMTHDELSEYFKSDWRFVRIVADTNNWDLVRSGYWNWETTVPDWTRLNLNVFARSSVLNSQNRLYIYDWWTNISYQEEIFSFPNLNSPMQTYQAVLENWRIELYIKLPADNRYYWWTPSFSWFVMQVCPDPTYSVWTDLCYEVSTNINKMVEDGAWAQIFFQTIDDGWISRTVPRLWWLITVSTVPLVRKSVWMWYWFSWSWFNDDFANFDHNFVFSSWFFNFELNPDAWTLDWYVDLKVARKLNANHTWRHLSYSTHWVELDGIRSEPMSNELIYSAWEFYNVIKTDFIWYDYFGNWQPDMTQYFTYASRIISYPDSMPVLSGTPDCNVLWDPNNNDWCTYYNLSDQTDSEIDRDTLRYITWPNIWEYAVVFADWRDWYNVRTFLRDRYWNSITRLYQDDVSVFDWYWNLAWMWDGWCLDQIKWNCWSYQMWLFTNWDINPTQTVSSSWTQILPIDSSILSPQVISYFDSFVPWLLSWSNYSVFDSSSTYYDKKIRSFIPTMTWSRVWWREVASEFNYRIQFAEFDDVPVVGSFFYTWFQLSFYPPVYTFSTNNTPDKVFRFWQQFEVSNFIRRLSSNFSSIRRMSWIYMLDYFPYSTEDERYRRCLLIEPIVVLPNSWIRNFAQEANTSRYKMLNSLWTDYLPWFVWWYSWSNYLMVYPEHTINWIRLRELDINPLDPNYHRYLMWNLEDDIFTSDRYDIDEVRSTLKVLDLPDLWNWNNASETRKEVKVAWLLRWNIDECSNISDTELLFWKVWLRSYSTYDIFVDTWIWEFLRTIKMETSSIFGDIAFDPVLSTDQEILQALAPDYNPWASFTWSVWWDFDFTANPTWFHWMMAWRAWDHIEASQDRIRVWRDVHNLTEAINIMNKKITDLFRWAMISYPISDITISNTDLDMFNSPDIMSVVRWQENYHYVEYSNPTSLWYKDQPLFNIWDDYNSFIEYNSKDVLIVKWANVYIWTNIIKSNDLQDWFMVIALKDEAWNWGNVFIDVNVTNIDMFIIADGSLLSAVKDASWISIVDENETATLADAINQLKNQLYIRWAIYTRNTMWWADRPYSIPAINRIIMPNIPWVNINSFADFETLVSTSLIDALNVAKRFDINYLRYYAWVFDWSWNAVPARNWSRLAWWCVWDWDDEIIDCSQYNLNMPNPDNLFHAFIINKDLIYNDFAIFKE